MADPLELELKLEFEPADRKRLEAAVLRQSAQGATRHLVSTYFDTPERALLAAGYTLRVRRSGKRRLQTVKGSGSASAGLFVRTEWECAIKGDAPILDERSGPLTQLISADMLDRIGPIFKTDVQRTTVQIEGADATIELVIDNGEVRAGDRVEPICEMELELRGGSPAALFDLARQVDEQVPLRIGVRSKSERGYALAADEPGGPAKAEPILLDRDGDAGDAFRVIAPACIRHFRLNEAILTKSDEAELVHQARVGLRRLRSAFSLYKPLLIDDPRTALFSAELRWLAAELGEVRNIDVLIPRYGDDARARLVTARDRTFARAQTELASSRTRLLMIDLVEWLADGEWHTAPSRPAQLHRNIIDFASDLLDVRAKRLKRRGKGLADLSAERRHRVRIEAKKLRYATEFFTSLYPSEKARRRHERFLDALKELQDLLGELNDLAIGPKVLRRLGIDVMLPKPAKHERQDLLEKAERAYDALMRTKCFWRVRADRQEKTAIAPGHDAPPRPIDAT